MTPEVILLAHTPQPTRIMALAARLCYTQGMSIQGLNEQLTDEDCERLVRKIISNKHHGVLEHATFTFGVEGVSRDFLQQMARHRHTSFDVQSLHYTLARDGFEMAAPVFKNEEDRLWWDTIKTGAFKLYKHLVDQGVPREVARHILPGGIETKLVMTACLRQWMKFIEIRSCVVNVHEITAVAHKVRNILVELMPYLKDVTGPTCNTDGFCAEGKKFCNSPWKTPCKITGDGLNDVVNTREEAMAWTHIR